MGKHVNHKAPESPSIFPTGGIWRGMSMLECKRPGNIWAEYGEIKGNEKDEEQRKENGEFREKNGAQRLRCDEGLFPSGIAKLQLREHAGDEDNSKRQEQHRHKFPCS